MSDLLLQVYVQNNGGKLYYYPYNQIAAGFCRILNQKTLTEQNMKDIRAIGADVEIIRRANDKTIEQAK